MTTTKPTLFGYGLTTKAIAKKLGVNVTFLMIMLKKHTPMRWVTISTPLQPLMQTKVN